MINQQEIESYRLPLSTEEDWRLTPLSRLYRTAEIGGIQALSPTKVSHEEIAPYLIAGCDHLVVVDGLVDRELSAAALHYLAAGESETIVADYTGLARLTREFNSPLTQLAMRAGGKNRPLQLLRVTTATAPSTQHSRMVLAIAAGVTAELVETEISLAPQNRTVGVAWHNHQLELHLGAGAKLNSYHQFGPAAGRQAFDTHGIAARLDSAALWQATKVMRAESGMESGQGFIRHDIGVELTGPEAEFNLRAIVLAENSQQIGLSTRIQHQSPHCRSQQSIKAISRDQSEVVMQGLIWVHPDAQQTQAHLLARGMILPPTDGSPARGQITFKPELKIFADDVKCSHGATVGELDREALFYLTSRGLTAMAAREILVAAFIASALESLDQLSEPAIAAAAQRVILGGEDYAR